MDSTGLTPPAAGTRPERRNLLIGTVATIAAVAGAGVAWWRHEPGDIGSTALDSFWAASFDSPQGVPLAMTAFRGKPLLINFWATWCPPCVDELPLIDAFYQESATKSWQVFGLAIDQPSAVRAFLGRRPVSFPVGMAGLEGTELGKSLGNTSGGLPFSVAVSARGAVLHRKMGRLTPSDLAAWAKQA